MPASHPSLYKDPEEAAAWRSLEAAETALEAVLLRTPGRMPELGGLIYYIDDGQRMVAAPARLDGSPDRENAAHRSEYEGLGADDMNNLAAEINSWLRAQ